MPAAPGSLAAPDEGHAYLSARPGLSRPRPSGVSAAALAPPGEGRGAAGGAAARAAVPGAAAGGGRVGARGGLVR
jgi:hypothetical protein